MTNLTIYLAMMMLSSNFSATTASKAQPQMVQTQQVAQHTEDEQRFMDMVNSERWARGLQTLKLDTDLIAVAREHCKDMQEKGYFDHKSPTYGKTTPMDRYLSFLGKRPTWAYLGENLFYSSITDINRGHKCLMDSEHHRDNILNPRFDSIGVGIYKDADGQFWVTELFLSKVD